jgi:3-oxoacyl-[acyl-carrier-protein] synthase II
MVTPLGVTVAATWDALLQGKSGIKRIEKFDPRGCRTRIGGELPAEYEILERGRTPKRLFKQTIRAGRMIRVCADDALRDSATGEAPVDPERCAVIIGTTGTSVRSPQDLGGPETERFTVIREMINALPAWISIEHGYQGPSFTVSAACASGSYAIATACDLIRSGSADLAVAGGVDSLLTENCVRRGNAMHVLSLRNDQPDRAMRPFDRKRDGWVLSDGGCAVVLESYERATKRNANVYAWVRGHGSISEAHSLFAAARDGVGMEETIELALENAGIAKDRVGYVNANGTSTKSNDAHETAALRRVFNGRAERLLISSQKSMLGHCMGASSALEFAFTALSLKNGEIPPTINYEFPDPECDLNYVPNAKVSAPELDVAITNTFSFGGHNCVLVLSRTP